MNSEQLARAKGMLSVDEVREIKRAVSDIHDVAQPIAVNIGAGLGTSTLAMLEASPDIFIFEVDKRLRPGAIQAVEEYAHQKRVARIVGKSWIVGANWPFPVDLVFVDGAHMDEAVIADIEAWLPKINPFGKILFHDYNHPNLPRLKRIVNEKMRGYQAIYHARYLIGYEVK